MPYKLRTGAPEKFKEKFKFGTAIFKNKVPIVANNLHYFIGMNTDEYNLIMTYRAQELKANEQKISFDN